MDTEVIKIRSGYYVDNGQINQCDGCQAGLPLINGSHKDYQWFGISCTRHLYLRRLTSDEVKELKI